MSFTPKYTYEDVHMIYYNLKVHSLPSSFCFSMLNFKTFFLRLEVGDKFETLHNESDSEYLFVEIHL